MSEGATPKDGPSAGAITLTIYSQLLNKKIDNTYALTGEIRLMNGTISKIGGLDLKIKEPDVLVLKRYYVKGE